MYNLVKTNLQKTVLLIWGILIFFKLFNVNYYNRHNAILFSIGITILAFVFLIILRDYHPTKIIAFIKKYKKQLIFLIIFIFLILSIFFGRTWYLNIQEKKTINAQNEKFHNAEVAYQKCLDKISNSTKWEKEKTISPISGGLWKRTIGVNKYFDEWIKDNRPNYNQNIGHWEWAFMEWMIEKYPKFCEEYDVALINYFLDEKETNILNLPKLPSLKGVDL